MALSINLRPFKEFLQSGQIGGFLLLAAVLLSLVLANIGLDHELHSLLSIKIGNDLYNLQFTIEQWINDGLMAVFFLLVGLEIKRELLEGELSSPKKAALPFFAALGGMICPAIIYHAINKNASTASGWGIPMATDIAFALAIISLLGKKVPTSLKVFLAALAIVDDLGAIVVIALFYSSELHYTYLIYAGIIIAGLTLLNIFKVRQLVFYLVPGVFLWYFIHHSGIHATIAGVLLAFTIPTNPDKSTSPLEKLEHILNKPVNFCIMPLFALVNTLIKFENQMIEGLSTPLGLGIIAGLLIGKTTGISLFSWIAVKLNLSSLPARSTWKHIMGVSMLGGIGFTMSVFIALLSFKDASFQTEAKFAILLASTISGLLGYTFLSWLYKKTEAKRSE